MEEIASQILRPGTFAVAVAVFIVTWFTRRVVETVWPDLRKNGDENAVSITYVTPFARWWNTVILYAIPVTLGGLIGVIPSDFLHGDIKDVGGRILFQAGVGWFASFLYKVMRKVILKKTGVDIKPGSIRPENYPSS